MALELDLASSTFKANPYPILQEIHTQDPLLQVILPGDRKGWLVTKYKDADFILRDPRFVKDSRNALTPEQIARQFPWQQEQQEAHGEAITITRNMLEYDPPDHTRLRALVNTSFTSRLIERWHGRIQTIADELLDAVADKGEMDLIDAFAFPLSSIVLTEMLGIPSEDRQKFRTWSNTIIETSGDPHFENKREQIMAFRAYLKDLIHAKRRSPSNDLLDQLIQAESEGDRLSEGELISMVTLLLVAGHETTVNLIGNSIFALLLHPDQKEKLQQTPSLLRMAIEEFLRFHSPLMTTTRRWARENVTYRGKLIQRGDIVLVVLASANRDPDVFVHAEELDITRQDNRHLAFGKGIHFCLGAPLARLEGQVAISTLLRRMPKIRLAVEPQELVWRPGMLIMGLRTLPVAF